jgi:DNA-binding LacI/PurR family transcriptional regulator
MAVTLRDVAAHAGVSARTVSNVVNDFHYVSTTMRAKVQAAIEELDYRPNLSARSLRRGRSGVVALAVPALDNAYFAELTRCVVQQAEALGFTVLVDQTDGLHERERLVATGVRSHLIDGLILSPVAMDHAELAQLRSVTPLVLIGEKLGHGDVDHVAIDNVGASRDATDHLLSLGRRRVGAIGYQAAAGAHTGTALLRTVGYEQSLAAAGIPVQPRLTRQATDYTRRHGAEAMTSLLDEGGPGRRVDAVFCFNDQLALGALHTLARAGVRVPEDVAVIGLDDIEDGRFSTPTLSTIAPDKDAVARESLALLHRRMHDPGAASEEVRVGHALVPRESTLGRV